MTTKALIVVDLQNDYFPGGKWVLDGISAATANAARLITASREAGDQVIHVRHEFPATEAPFFASGSQGAETHQDVLPIDGEPTVLKNHVNSFRDTGLKDILEKNGIENVVICGAMSHLCIDATTRAASDLGYTCTLIHDACASRDQEFDGLVVPAKYVHAGFMAALGFGYADVISTDKYLS